MLPRDTLVKLLKSNGRCWAGYRFRGHRPASLLSGMRQPESGLLLLNGLDRPHTIGAQQWRKLGDLLERMPAG